MQPLVPQDFHRWKVDLRKVCGNFDVRRSAADHHFFGSADRLEFGALEMARIQSNAASISHARHASRHADRYCFLVLQLQGHQHLAVDGLEPADLKTGDLMLLDPASPFEMLPHGFVDNLSVHLPRAMVKAQLPGRNITGKLSGDMLSVQLLASLVRQVASTPGYSASNDEADAVRRSMMALIASAIRPDEGEVATTSLYKAACARIDSSLASFELTPDWVADKLMVSRRQLYRAFAAEGCAGIAQFILGRRLKRAAELLCDAERRAQTIGTIALEVGMADFAHFSRAFRRGFGCSPSQFRLTRRD